MKKILLSIITIISFSAISAQCDEIFISEYVEGWSNNKAIELVNPTNDPIDLSGYTLKRYSNGSTTASSAYTVQLSGIIPAKDVYVFVIDKRNPAGTGQEAPVWDTLQNQADAFICPDYNVSSVMYFNGNDALALFKGTKVVDVFGKIGEDPGDGWPLNSGASDYVAWTKDHVLIRKFNITKGDVTPTDAFDPSVEWDSLSPLNFSNLGEHFCNCSGMVSTKEIEKTGKFEVFPNPSNGNNITIKASTVPKTVSVFSITGTQVLSQNATSTTVKVNTEKLSKGIYFVSLYFNEGNKLTKKIVIN